MYTSIPRTALTDWEEYLIGGHCDTLLLNVLYMHIRARQSLTECSSLLLKDIKVSFMNHKKGICVFLSSSMCRMIFKLNFLVEPCIYMCDMHGNLLNFLSMCIKCYTSELPEISRLAFRSHLSINALKQIRLQNQLEVMKTCRLISWWLDIN